MDCIIKLIKIKKRLMTQIMLQVRPVCLYKIIRENIGKGTKEGACLVKKVLEMVGENITRKRCLRERVSKLQRNYTELLICKIYYGIL